MSAANTLLDFYNAINSIIGVSEETLHAADLKKRKEKTETD